MSMMRGTGTTGDQQRQTSRNNARRISPDQTIVGIYLCVISYNCDRIIQNEVVTIG